MAKTTAATTAITGSAAAMRFNTNAIMTKDPFSNYFFWTFQNTGTGDSSEPLMFERYAAGT